MATAKAQSEAVVKSFEPAVMTPQARVKTQRKLDAIKGRSKDSHPSITRKQDSQLMNTVEIPCQTSSRHANIRMKASPESSSRQASDGSEDPTEVSTPTTLSFRRVDSSGDLEDLPTALPVDEPGNDMVESVEPSDAEAVQSMRRRGSYVVFVALAALLLFSTAATILILVASSNSGFAVSTKSPTRSFDDSIVQPRIEAVFGDNVFANSTGPFAKALQWIGLEDPLVLSMANATFFQRYLTAYVYYATIKDRPWRYCNPPSDGDRDTCLHSHWLSFLPTRSSRWLSGEPECTWAGIECDSLSQIQKIDFSGLGLSGPFPESIRHFPFLKEIVIDSPYVMGSIPSTISSMKHLLKLNFAGSQFEGSLPSQLWGLRGLTHCSIKNALLTGSVPYSKDLKELDLSGNMLSGTISDRVGDLRSLSQLKLGVNKLDGTMPPSIGNLSHLGVLQLHGNILSGPIPSEYGQLSRLSDLRLGDNPLMGEIPGEIYDLNRLLRLDLRDANLTGKLGPGIGRLTDLQYLYLSTNKLDGELPPELQNATALELLWLNQNDFSGQVPTDVCSRGARINIRADCRPDLASGVPEIECPTSCCNQCCYPAGDQCL